MSRGRRARRYCVPPTIALVRAGTTIAEWPIERDERPALELVDELARLQLVAGRFGCRIEVRGACDDLRRLLELCGLSDVLLASD